MTGEKMLLEYYNQVKLECNTGGWHSMVKGIKFEEEIQVGPAAGG